MGDSAVSVRPITQDDLDLISGACWEGRESQLRLLAAQDCLGMGAWQGSLCVGLLHAYRVTLPDWDDREFPGYGREQPVSWPLGWPLLAAREQRLPCGGPVWGHACFHVGYVGPEARHADPAYFGQGIGIALCEASIHWARERGYVAVIAQGGTKAAPGYNTWMGCLPWTTYQRLGFECVAQEPVEDGLPWWAHGEARPEVLAEVQQAVEAGRADELPTRLMVLRL